MAPKTTASTRNPIHPGEILSEEYLEPFGLTPYALAQAIGVDAPRIYKIVEGKRSISADTALRLGRFFDTSAQFWLNLQDRYDLRMAEQKKGVRESLARIERITAGDAVPRNDVAG